MEEKNTDVSLQMQVLRGDITPSSWSAKAAKPTGKVSRDKGYGSDSIAISCHTMRTTKDTFGIPGDLSVTPGICINGQGLVFCLHFSQTFA